MHRLIVIATIICCISSCSLAASKNSALSMPAQIPIPMLSGMASQFFGQPPSASNQFSMSDSTSSSQTPQFIPLPTLTMSSISKSSTSSEQLSALLNQSSFPLLGSSVAPHMSITPQVEKIPQSFLLSMGKLSLHNLFYCLNFNKFYYLCKKIYWPLREFMPISQNQWHLYFQKYPITSHTKLKKWINYLVSLYKGIFLKY